MVPVYCVPHTCMNVVADVVSAEFGKTDAYSFASDISRVLYDGHHTSARVKRLMHYIKTADLCSCKFPPDFPFPTPFSHHILYSKSYSCNTFA